MSKKRRSSDVIGASEAAELVGSHVETVRRLARRGDIPAFKVGRDWRFSREALQRWAEGEPRFTSSVPSDYQPTVLVVDDEEQVRQIVARLVEKAGYRAREAADGIEGLVEIHKDPPDLLILDLVMPGLNGPDLLERIHEDHPSMPVIIITGHPDSALVARAAEYVPLMLLTKPIDVVKLHRALEMALKIERQKTDSG